MSDVLSAKDIKSIVGAEIGSGLASGAVQLGYDALMRLHNEKREDTRYQRLANDLGKAGFSKNIVSGATASANQAPTSDVSFLGDSFSKGMSRKMQLEELNLQRTKNNAEVSNMKKTNQQLDAIIEGLNIDNMSKLEDLQHKRHINSLSDLEREKMQEEINKLKRDMDRLELEKSRTNSYVEKQKIESEIKKIEKDIAYRDYQWISKTPFPSFAWNGADLGDFRLMNGTILSKALIDKMREANANGKPVNSSTSAFKNFIDGVILGNKKNKKYWK